jgi:hypothetical protein
MKRDLHTAALEAMDELRFAEIYLHAAYAVVDDVDPSEDKEAIALMVSDCAARLKCAMALLEEGRSSTSAPTDLGRAA